MLNGIKDNVYAYYDKCLESELGIKMHTVEKHILTTTVFTMPQNLIGKIGQQFTKDQMETDE
jgi:hypothetical protein